MHVGTDADITKLLSDEKWNCGIKSDGQSLYYENQEADCIELKFPDTPERAGYFAAALQGSALLTI